MTRYAADSEARTHAHMQVGHDAAYGAHGQCAWLQPGMTRGSA